MKRKIYNAGDVVGPYTLIERISENKWKCECNICKSIVDVFSSNLSRQKMCRNCRAKFNLRPRIDLTNRRFTKLIAKKYVGNSKWECLCDCGNTTIALTNHLLSGHTRSCGCLIGDWIRNNLYKDYSGTKIEKITFKYRIEDYVSPKGQKLAQYRCVCDCGVEFNAIACNVLNGNTRSCGCIGNSYGEYYIKKVLDELNIKHDTEYSFPDLRSPLGGLLRFDFVLFDEDDKINRLIEFQGEQHFYSPERKTEFGQFTREISDPMKEEYCKTNNIILEKIRFDEDIPKALNEIINRYIASQSRAKQAI